MNILLFLTPKHDVAYLYDDFTMRQALEKMEFHRYSAIPILDRTGRYVGTITEGDLLWEVKRKGSLSMRKAESIPVAEIPLSTRNEPVRVDTTMEELIEKALNQNFVPVIDDRGYFIGLVKRKAIIQYCYERMQNHSAGFATSLETEGPAERELSFRPAVEEDIPLLLYYVKEYANYEKLGQPVSADEETLREFLFRRKTAEAVIGEADGQPVGYALYFHNFSTCMGRAGLYLEDLYIHPAYRGRGYGRLFLRRIAQLTLERGCGGWDGAAWTGRNRASIFIRKSAPGRWRAGPSSAWMGKIWKKWQTSEILRASAMRKKYLVPKFCNIFGIVLGRLDFLCIKSQNRRESTAGRRSALPAFCMRKDGKP